MVEAPIAEQAKRPFTVGIGLVIWNRYCCLRMIGIRYFLHRPLVPIVPQASAWRCILYAKRERASRDDCTWPIDAGILPLSGYIEPWQHAHQKSWSSGKLAVSTEQRRVGKEGVSTCRYGRRQCAEEKNIVNKWNHNIRLTRSI